MQFSFANINYLSVLIAGLATFFLGAVWYQILFGKLWISLHGYTKERMEQMHRLRPPALFFGGMLASYLLLAFVLAVLLNSFHLDTVAAGLTFGALIWLGPALAIGFTAYLASDKPIGVFFIDAGYQLTFLLMIGAILAGWH